MQRLAVLTVFVLAMLAIVNVNAGSVTIRGKCVDCNKPDEESTTHKSSSGHHSKTTATPEDTSDEQMPSNRFKRQWGNRQVINLGEGFRDYPVTTIDSRGYPGTVVRNADCVGCNIRG